MYTVAFNNRQFFGVFRYGIPAELKTKVDEMVQVETWKEVETEIRKRSIPDNFEQINVSSEDDLVGDFLNDFEGISNEIIEETQKKFGELEAQTKQMTESALQFIRGQVDGWLDYVKKAKDEK